MTDNASLIEELRQQIEELKPEAEYTERRNYNKMTDNNSYQRQINELEEVIVFLSLPYDIKVEPYDAGLYIINDKYVVGTRNRRWRVSGRNKWYYYKNPEHFIKNYVCSD